MPELENALARAAKRMKENSERITHYEQRLQAIDPDSDAARLAADILDSLKRTQALFENHYRSLGGTLA